MTEIELLEEILKTLSSIHDGLGVLVIMFLFRLLIKQ